MQIKRNYNIANHFAWDCVFNPSFIVDYSHCDITDFKYVCGGLLCCKLTHVLLVKLMAHYLSRHACLGLIR